MPLHTTLGERRREELGLILPHEHVFVDLGGPDSRAYEDADPAAVVEVMTPYLEEARDAGVTALVESTPVGVGRRADVDVAVSEAAGLPVVVPTGLYQAPYWPDWARAATEEELATWLIDELVAGIEGADVRAGWIKLAASDPLADRERRALRAAARASAETGAVVGSHTPDGDLAREQLDVFEAAGGRAGRFVWIHAQNEGDPAVHREIAERGAYVEYDTLGSRGDEYFLERVSALVDAGLTDRVLLSHDRGWYDPSEPGGGDQRPYTHLSERFLPALREAVGDATARRLTHDNPYDAFAR
jgi:phosphotriesterase-related protein